MPKIKVFSANLGFYEAAVAARSQKMALAHWGVTRDLFREDSARESHDPKAVEAAMRKVGMVVRRPIGSAGPFEERKEAEQALLKRFKTKPRATAKKAKSARTPAPRPRAAAKGRKKKRR